MNMSPEEYAALTAKLSPPSPLWPNLLKSFFFGGLICCLGQGLLALCGALGWGKEEAAAFCSITLIFLGALLTGLGVYDELARLAAAGSLVPITGFSNSVASPALEYRREGLVTGLACKMFTVAGPVIVYGTVASMVYGFIYWLLTM